MCLEAVAPGLISFANHKSNSSPSSCASYRYFSKYSIANFFGPVNHIKCQLSDL